jgi:hypothetical protein
VRVNSAIGGTAAATAEEAAEGDEVLDIFLLSVRRDWLFRTTFFLNEKRFAHEHRANRPQR